MIDEKKVLLILAKAYFFLKFRPRSQKEIENYLEKNAQKYHWQKDEIIKVTEILKKQNLINDRDFVNWFVSQRNILKPKGKFLLTKELLNYGVDKKLIDEYLAQNPSDEEKLAIKALRQRWLRFKKLNKQKRFEKSAAFLLRRGFDFETVKKAINILENNYF